MPLNLAGIDERMDAANAATVERLAAAALAELHAMVVHARRSIGQTTRFTRERLARQINDARNWEYFNEATL